MARVDDTSDPLGHAAPDAELAEVRLAAGEAQAREPDPEPLDAERFEDDQLEDEPLEDEQLEDDRGGSDRGGSRGRRGGGGGDDARPPEDAEGHPASRPARHRNRLIAFLQGSWRELQRVQWPDQRQTVQATWVVIGFVIVAGAWLGLADWVSTKIVNFLF